MEDFSEVGEELGASLMMFMKSWREFFVCGALFAVGNGNSWATQLELESSAFLENKTSRKPFEKPSRIDVTRTEIDTLSPPSSSNPIERAASIVLMDIETIVTNYQKLNNMRNQKNEDASRTGMIQYLSGGISFLVDDLERRLPRLMEYGAKDRKEYFTTLSDGGRENVARIAYALCKELEDLPKGDCVPHPKVAGIFDIPESVLYPPENK